MMSSSNSKGKTNTRTPIVKPFLAIYSILVLVMFLLVASWYALKSQQELNYLNEQETQLVKMHENRILQEYKEVLSDLLTISSLPGYQSILNQKFTNVFIKQQINNTYLTVSRIKARYDQIRFLNNQGKEIVRVNFNEGHPSAVPERELQDKSHRYYIQEMNQLSENEIYVSPMDLNLEKRQIERPFKPVIRVGFKIRDANQNPVGIVTLNYLARYLLETLERHIHPLDGVSNLTLLNQDGYWLKGTSPEQEWGFMFKDRRQQTIAQKRPKLWEEIKQLKEGQIRTDQGLYTFKTLYPLDPRTFSTRSGYNFSQHVFNSGNNPTDRAWILLSFIPKSVYTQKTDWLLKEAQAFLAVTLLILGVLSYLIAHLRRDKRLLRKQTHFMAYHDELTGVYNRHVLFQEKNHKKLLKLEKPPEVLFFIDLDGFKPINDNYGHHIGDEVLKIIAKRLQNSIRTSDFVIRLGGDEFVVIMPDLNDQESAQTLGEKLLAAICSPMHIESLTLEVGASIGAAISTRDHPLTLQQLIDRADSAMYRAKEQGKGQVSIAHPD